MTNIFESKDIRSVPPKRGQLTRNVRSPLDYLRMTKTGLHMIRIEQIHRF